MPSMPSDLQDVRAVMEELHKGTQLHEDGVADRLHIEWQMPQLCTKQAVRTLRKLGAKIVTCDREADALLPSILQQTPGAYAGDAPWIRAWDHLSRKATAFCYMI